MFSKIILPVLGSAVVVSAHGFVSNIVINGVSYGGYDVTSFPYQANPPTVVGWATTATDLGFVAPDAYNSSDIICHRGATNAKGHAQVAAGDEVFLQWNTWPESHKGPVLSYLAACGSAGCETVDKTTLEFFKIDEKGLIDGSGSPGTYADDELMGNGLGWLVKIPTNVASGFYVLRHEMIALHSAENPDGAQNYPQCINLEITGGGSDTPSGTPGTALYNANDPGILVNIYTPTNTYAIPGPPMISGASEVSQTSSAVTSTGTATTGTELAAGAVVAGAATAASAQTAVASTFFTSTLRASATQAPGGACSPSTSTVVVTVTVTA